MKKKNSIGAVQTSHGEQLRYGILPNKYCIIVKAVLEELYQKNGRSCYSDYALMHHYLAYIDKIL
jgi:hypothetical protein